MLVLCSARIKLYEDSDFWVGGEHCVMSAQTGKSHAMGSVDFCQCREHVLPSGMTIRTHTSA